MQEFRSKIGNGISLLVIAIIGGAMIPTFRGDINWVGIIICLGALTFIFYFFASIRYTICDEFLTLSTNLFIFQKIPISSITDIAESHNPIAAPAASLDRLEIRYDAYGLVIVSPKDKKGFIEALKAINPTIKVEYRNSRKSKTSKQEGHTSKWDSP